MTGTYEQAFAALMECDDVVTVELSRLEAWAVLTAILMASQQPGASAYTVKIARDVARVCQGHIAHYPALNEAALDAWHGLEMAA